MYVGNTSDISETLGDGWFHVDGLGTVYGNDSYKKVVSAPDVMYAGQTAEIKIYEKTLDGTIGFTAWIDGSSSPTAVTYVGYDAASFTYTVRLAANAGLSAGDTFDLAIGAGGGRNIKTLTVTVGEPYAVSAEYTGSAIEAIKNTDILLNSINISVTYSDGTVKQEHPVSYTGYDKTGAVGTAQTVKFFYGTGSDDYVEIQVTPVEPEGDVVTAINVTKKSGVDKIVYSASSPLNLGDYFDVTATYTASGSKTVSITDAKLTVSEVKSGKNNITFTFVDGASVSTTLNDVEIWQEISTVAEWNGINNNADSLAGYYILKNDINLTGAQSIGCLPLNQVSDTYFDITDVSGTGRPFTGKFDGNNKTITGFKTTWAMGTGWNAEYFGGALFTYIGAGAEVCNFTLSGAQVQAPNYTAFIASCNCGLIENVSVVGGSIFSNFGGSTENEETHVVTTFGAGAIACYNYGTVKSCESDVVKFTKSGDVELDLALVSENRDDGKVE